MTKYLSVDREKFDVQVSEQSETPRRSDFLGTRPYIWYASCLKNFYNAVDRIAMPLLGTFYDAINSKVRP